MNFEFDESYGKFRVNLRFLLESRGYQSKYIAEQIGVTDVTMSHYATGFRKPDLKTVLRLSQFFHVSPEWLIGFNDPAIDSNANKFLEAYNRATKEDKQIIDLILNKYL